MSLRINNNVAALNAYRNLSASGAAMGKSLEKLSSGFRINRAADDAAGLVKSEKLRSEITGNKGAIKNAQDGVSFVQTAEGALSEIHSILQRIRELAVDAANTATTDGVAQQAEVAELLKEIDSIGSKTTFSGKKVFTDYSASGAALSFHIGSGSADALSFAQDLRLTSASVFGAPATVTLTGTTAAAAIATIDTAIASVSSVRSTLGATQNRLEHTISNLAVTVENLTASESRIRDTDMALEMANFTRHQILNQAGVSMLAQANQAPQAVLSLLR
jgi:flagellin